MAIRGLTTEVRFSRMAVERIPFNLSSLEGNELQFLKDSVSSGHNAAKGPYSVRVSELLQEALGAKEVLLTTSCTAALELSAMLLDIEPGDNVIVPSFAFVTTALAFTREGAELRFADIEADTLGLDPDSVENLIDDRTRAVVPIHYGGIAMAIAPLMVLCERMGVDVVEDNAHGLFGSAQGRPLGSLGRFSTLSFHETKNFSCGEGGALVINCEQDVSRAHTLYDKGTNRESFRNNHVDRYTWIDKGSSFGMSDLLAAYLLGQLEQRAVIMKKRKNLFDHYHSALFPLQERLGFRVPLVPQGHGLGYHMFYVLASNAKRRTAVLRELNESGIGATFHYQPLHHSTGAQPWTTQRFDCPTTDSVSSRIIRLPFFTSQNVSQAERVVEALIGAFERAV